jgi:hypothetical protein
MKAEQRNGAMSMSGKGAGERRHERRAAEKQTTPMSAEKMAEWRAVMTRWKGILQTLDLMDKRLLAMGEREMAQRLVEMSRPMTVRLVYASGGQWDV